MNRPLTALFAALEALLVVGIGLGILLVPLTALWAFEFDLQIDWTVFYRAAADLWLIGHGVDVRFALDLPLVAGATPGEPFVVTIAALGLALLTALLGVRAGRRLLETDHPGTAITVTLGTFAGLSAIIALTAGVGAAQPSRWQGVLFPTLVFTVGIILGAVIPSGEVRRRPTSSRPSPFARLAEATLDRLPEGAIQWVSWSLRLGGVAAAGLMAVAAILVAGLLVIGYSTVITLYESLQSGVLGGAALTIAQLALLPNLVIWAAAWLVGPGFAIGTGSSVSPVGTALGPVPSLPVLGAIPTTDSAFGFLGLAAPIVVAFLAGALLRSRLNAGWRGELSTATVIGLGVSGGVVAGVALGLLSWAAAGSAGVGRLTDIGSDPWLVGAFAALETAVAMTIGLVVSGRRERPSEE
ncbi:DUF6350 family protein [Amnibacterium flavum]|uniref:Uncharacterized protein n=1 Tax=Amnibacterium flavum TaxID=2173173 RepID=A0A2V1HVJ4_9MICO|nr:DUF6350 family protein [Amnibacterium flavum]PVZ95030.1 hypothetical protein DDQ50_00380 [Amnibacterium flavum]